MRNVHIVLLTGVIALSTIAAPAAADPPRFDQPLCAGPAVTDFKITNGRWPSTVDGPRQFALDAVRLSGAKTEQEKAIAVWLWTRRMTMYTDGVSPTERCAAGRGYVSDPVRIFNVFGAHWCDGLSRCMEWGWRGLGHRAQKFYKSGHTLCDAYWVDDDGVGRYHLFDVSENWFAFTRDGSRIANAEDICRDRSLTIRPAVGPMLMHHSDHLLEGWVHAVHVDLDSGHRMGLDLRAGDSFSRMWGNDGKPYQDNIGPPEKQLAWELGPYGHGYGNGVWTWRPNVWGDGLKQECHEQPVNVEFNRRPGGFETERGAHVTLAPYLHSADASKPSILTWRIRTPYIISSLLMTLPARAGHVNVEISDDGGKRWRTIESDKAGGYELAPPVRPPQPKQKDFDRKEFTETISAFGRYDVLVRLTLAGVWQINVGELVFETTVQQNYLALPRLLPGDNQITLRGKLAKGQAVRATYVWEDPAGKVRRNVTVAESLPYTYRIRAAGANWNDVVCKQLDVQVISADGKGNRTIEKELQVPLQQMAALPGWQRSLGDMPVPPLRPLAEYVKVLKTSDDKVALREALAAVRVIGDKAAWDAVRHVAMTNLGLEKIQALQTLYWLDADRAMADFEKIIRDTHPDIRFKQDAKNPAVRGGHWTAVVAVLSRFAADRKRADLVAPLLAALQSEHNWAEPRRAMLRSLGELGDKSAGPVLGRFLGDVDDAEVAVEAIGRLGCADALPQIRRLARSDYTPLARNALVALGRLADRESIPLARELLSTKDEDIRGAAADALGQLATPGDTQTIAALQKQWAAETFPWVKEIIQASLAKLAK